MKMKAKHVARFFLLLVIAISYGKAQLNDFDRAEQAARYYVYGQLEANPRYNPRTDPAMFHHLGRGNGRNRLPNPPAGYRYYEFYVPFNLEYQRQLRGGARLGRRRVIIAFNARGQAHPVWFYTNNHYNTYQRRVRNQGRDV